MKTFLYFWRYLDKYLLKWEMFEIKVVDKIKTHILRRYFFPKSYRLWDNVKKCGVDRGATNDVTIWRKRVVCWISKAKCICAHAYAQASVYLHARTHAHVCTHRPISNTYCFTTATMIRERASMLRCASLRVLFVWRYFQNVTGARARFTRL